MKTLKDQKGITLVALVITIIVLLILAGISLSLVMGDNGILGRATNASYAQKVAAIRDQVELEVANLATDFYQAKYVNGDATVGTEIGTYVAQEGITLNLNTLPNGVTAASVTFGTVSNGKIPVTLTTTIDGADKTFTGAIDKDTAKFDPAINISVNN